MADYATTTDVYDHAGSNYDTNVTDARVNRFIEQAQSRINTETRYVWDTDFGSLADTVTHVLTEAAASWAAIQVIKWNPSTYTSLDEAKFLADVCLTTYRECIKILKDKVSTDWLKKQAGGG